MGPTLSETERNDYRISELFHQIRNRLMSGFCFTRQFNTSGQYFHANFRSKDSQFGFLARPDLFTYLLKCAMKALKST